MFPGRFQASGATPQINRISAAAGATQYATLTAALAAAGVGDIVMLTGNETFDLDSAAEGAAGHVTVPAGVTLRGSGWGTIINGSHRVDTGGTHAIVALAGLNPMVENLKIITPFLSAGVPAAGQYLPIGNYTGDANFTDAVIRNVWTQGTSDGLFVGKTTGTNTLRVYDSYFEGNYDCIVSNGNASDVVELYNCKSWAHPPDSIYNDARGVVKLKGTVYIFGGVHRAQNGQTNCNGIYVQDITNPVYLFGGSYENLNSTGSLSNSGINVTSTANRKVFSNGANFSSVSGPVFAADGGAHWIRVDYDLSNLATFASGLNTFRTQLISLPAGYQVTQVKQRVTTIVVKDPSITVLTSSVGPSGNDTKYGGTFSNLGAANTTKFDAVTGVESETANTTINAVFNSTGNTLDAVSTGKVSFWIQVSNPG